MNKVTAKCTVQTVIIYVFLFMKAFAKRFMNEMRK